MLNFTGLTPDEAFFMWLDFGIEIGLENLHKFYGNGWPRKVVHNERVWEVKPKVAWVSLRPDPVDPIIWMALGVFPEYQNKGLIHEIYRFAIETAFKEWPEAEAMVDASSKSNLEVIKYRERTSTKFGELNWPNEQYIIFGVKKPK